MGARAIVVDDHAAFRASARRLLELTGYDVVAEAGDGASGLALARDLEPQPVLLDVAPPDMSGVAWARRPHNRMGILMTLVAYCLLERKLQYSHNDVVFTFGFLFAELGLTVAFAHAVLAYPDGRLRARFERWFIGVSYVVVIAFSFALLTVWEGPERKSLFAIHPSRDAYDAIHAVYRVGVYGILGLLFIALIVRRGRGATAAGRRGLVPLMAAIVHDPELDAQPVEAAGAAARLALHNARLQADVSAQLAKVQESRRRIVTAGDEQRRKIERDLHDGAQQRLVALALELRIAQRQLAKDPEVEQGLAQAGGQLPGAVEELRGLARGGPPAGFTEGGA